MMSSEQFLGFLDDGGLVGIVGMATVFFLMHVASTSSACVEVLVSFNDVLFGDDVLGASSTVDGENFRGVYYVACSSSLVDC
jgi:hypothetical protein